MLNKSTAFVSLLALLTLSLGNLHQTVLADALPKALQPPEEKVYVKDQTADEHALVARLDRLETQLNEEKMHRSVLEAENQQTRNELGRLLSLIKASERLAVSNHTQRNQKADGRIGPTTCADYTVGTPPVAPADGFYLVRSTDGLSMQVEHCDFTNPVNPIGKPIGSVRVTSTSFAVHFHVQRETPFSAANARINFPIAQVLFPLGSSGMNPTTGQFIAPVAGFYRFSFSGIKDTNSPSPLRVQLRKGNVPIAEAYCTNLTGYYNSCSLEAVVNLEARETIDLYNAGDGVLYDSGSHLSQFTGSLLEEKLTLL